MTININTLSDEEKTVKARKLIVDIKTLINQSRLLDYDLDFRIFDTLKEEDEKRLEFKKMYWDKFLSDLKKVGSDYLYFEENNQGLYRIKLNTKTLIELHINFNATFILNKYILNKERFANIDELIADLESDIKQIADAYTMKEEFLYYEQEFEESYMNFVANNFNKDLHDLREELYSIKEVDGYVARIIEDFFKDEYPNLTSSTIEIASSHIMNRLAESYKRKPLNWSRYKKIKW